MELRAARPARAAVQPTGAQGGHQDAMTRCRPNAQADHRRAEGAQVDGRCRSRTAVSAEAAPTASKAAEREPASAIASDSQDERDERSSGARSRARSGCDLAGACAPPRNMVFISARSSPQPPYHREADRQSKRKLETRIGAVISSRSLDGSEPASRPSLSTRRTKRRPVAAGATLTRTSRARQRGSRRSHRSVGKTGPALERRSAGFEAADDFQARRPKRSSHRAPRGV